MSDEQKPEESATPGETPPPPPPPSEAELLVQAICKLSGDTEPYSRNCDVPAVQVTADGLVALMGKLRNEPGYNFVILCDHTAIDRIDEGIFELVYRLYSMDKNQMIMVSVSIPRDNPVVPTLCEIWKTAEFQEREVYDLFGVLYDNHPDLRRVFLEDDWKGFPLRKDYQDEFVLELERKD